MNRKLIRSTIIVLIQAITPIIALLLLTPRLIHGQKLSELNHFLIARQSWFLLWHGLFYLILYLSWPLLCRKMAQQHQLSDEQVRLIKQSRWYLIIIFVVIDSLMMWG